MTTSRSRAVLQAARLALAGAALLAAVHGASASDDAGLHQFFSAIFGGASQPAAAPPPVASAPPSRAPARIYRPRPLTVRLHPARPRVVVAQAPTRTGKVSIFEDPTLRRGDAVMTASGIRIFAGSDNWPHRAEDFVSLDEARPFSRDTIKVLAQLDRMPRG